MFKNISKLLLIILFYSATSVADIIKNIQVSGNERVSKLTIINFSQLEIGNNANQELLNKALKEIYDTNFFEDINFEFNNGNLIINVKELPVIQEIKVNGLKKSKLIEQLKEQISLKEKNPFNKSKVSNDVNKILNIFKKSGFYFAEIETSIENNDNNTVNIIFDINLGDKATINKIKFVGDKKFKDRKLFSVITSEESKAWKFISNKKYLDIERVNLDKRLLKNFYLEKGFYGVKIQDAYSQLVDNNKFVLIFNIDAGKKYYFGNFKLNLPSDFDVKKFSKLEKIFKKLNNEKYNFNKIENILNEIENISLIENYEFIDANVVEKIENDKVNFVFNVIETENIYVGKINIFGNNITAEEFIRDTLFVDEGDPFNNIMHTKSLNKLRSKGIFKSVTSLIKKDDEGKNIIDLIIEEKPTGEIMAGAGYGTDGSTISFGIKENNFNGRGIKLDTNVTIRQDSLQGKFSYTHPNFAYSDRELTSSIESSSTDKLSKAGYKSSLNKISLGTNYEQYEDLFFSPNFSLSTESIKTDATASAAYKKQEGSYFDTAIGYGLKYDKRNSSYQPTSGFVSVWSQKIPVISDDSSIFNSYQITTFKELVDDMIISSGIMAQAINSLSDKDVRVSKRLYIPSQRLRGFEAGKVGPKEGFDYVGGNYITTFNTSSTIPYILQTAENIDLKLFFDAANIWGVDYSSSVNDSNKIRSSAGVALEILTPVGPLSFSLSEAITKANTDITETFRFQLGTTF